MKVKKAALCGILCFLAVFFLTQSGFADPLSIDIKANGNDGPIVVPEGDSVSITISVVSGDKAGEVADWWVAVKTPFDAPGDWYSYVHTTGWKSGC